MSIQNASRTIGRRVALYRLLGRDGTLLYAGITRRVDTRFAEHKKAKYWWPQVARKTVEWHDSRVAARKAETAAIASESPAHNGEAPREKQLRTAGCSRCGPGGWASKRSA